MLQPTIVSGVAPRIKVIDQEIFTPVLSIWPFDQLGEVIEGINATPFGQATGIFTIHLEKAFQVARAIQSGGVHINGTLSSRVESMPYGGVKDSGFGREGPKYAIRGMTDENVVTVSLGTRRY